MARDSFLDMNAGVLRDSIEKLLAHDGGVLKPKQREAFIAMAESAPDEIARSYFKLPTAFGKTVMFVLMAREYMRSLTSSEQKSNRVVILVPRLSLVDQTLERLSEFADIDGVEFNSRVRGPEREKALAGNIIVSTYQSVDKLFDGVGIDNIGLVIADEAHHALGAKTSKLLRAVAQHAPVIGFTATPTYSDDHGVADLLENETFSMDIRDGVECGMLCPIKNILYRPSVTFDVASVPSTSAGDFNYDKFFGNLPGRVKLDLLANEIAKIYVNGGDGNVRFRDMRAMINCPNIDIAIAQAAAINKMAGRKIACAIHSQVKNIRELKSDFISGKYSVACQVNTMTEGFDDVSVGLCINYPSRSSVKIEQAGGRVVRINESDPGKIAYVVDTVFRAHDFEPLDETLITATNARQVLFRDVAGGFNVFPRQFIAYNAPARSVRDTSRGNTGISAENFDVITDNTVLMELEQKYDAWRARKPIEKKTPQWLSARDLMKVCIGRRIKISRALKAIHKKYPNIRIETKIGPGGNRLCVHVDELGRFVAASKDTRYPLTMRNSVRMKTQEWLTAEELTTHIVGNEAKLQSAIRAVLDNIHKYHGLRVEYRKSGGDIPRCVHVRDINKFIRAANKEGIILHRRADLPMKTPDVLSSSELRTDYIIGQPRDITSAMEYVAKNIKKYPNVRLGYYKRDGNHVMLCLNKNDIDAFLAAADNPKLKRANVAPDKTTGWAPVSDLKKKHIIIGDYMKIKDAMDIIFKNRDKHPDVRIMEMQSGSNVIPCIYLDDKNINAFIAAADMYDISLLRAGDEKNWISLDKLTRLISGTNTKIGDALRTIADNRNKYGIVRTWVQKTGRGRFYYLHVDDVMKFIDVANGQLKYKFKLKPDAIAAFGRGVSVLDAAARVRNVKSNNTDNPQNTK